MQRWSRPVTRSRFPLTEDAYVTSSWHTAFPEKKPMLSPLSRAAFTFSYIRRGQYSSCSTGRNTFERAGHFRHRGASDRENRCMRRGCFGSRATIGRSCWMMRRARLRVGRIAEGLSAYACYCEK